MSGIGPLTAFPAPIPAPFAPLRSPPPPPVRGEVVLAPHGSLTLLRGVSYAFFWKETEGPFRCCANWYHSPFALAGQLVFSTAEHALMYSKAALFGDTLSASAVLAAPTPKDAKALGRLVLNFDQALWD